MGVELFCGGGKIDVESLKIDGEPLPEVTVSCFEHLGNQLYDPLVAIFGQ